jgi:hypothetical protein
MILNVVVDNQTYNLDVPMDVVAGAEEMFDKMDADMDQGWKMGNNWIDKPDTIQRCQIVADKLLTALENENQNMSMLMAGYIINRRPGISSINIDISGDMQATEFS